MSEAVLCHAEHPALHREGDVIAQLMEAETSSAKTCFTVPRRQVNVLGNGLMNLFPFAGGTATPPRLDQDNGRIRAAPNSLCSKGIGKPTGPSTSMT